MLVLLEFQITLFVSGYVVLKHVLFTKRVIGFRFVYFVVHGLLCKYR